MTPLQITFDIANMSEAAAIIVVGMVGLLLWASARFDNPAAGVSTMVTVMLFALGATLDMGSELFWMGVVSTVVVLIAGLVVQVGE